MIKCFNVCVNYTGIPPLKINIPIRIAIKINGMSTMNHDTFWYPALQRAFNMNVQNTTYTALIAKTDAVLGTSHS